MLIKLGFFLQSIAPDFIRSLVSIYVLFHFAFGISEFQARVIALSFLCRCFPSSRGWRFMRNNKNEVCCRFLMVIRLDVYIHDYLLKRKMHTSAKAFLTEGKVATYPIGIQSKIKCNKKCRLQPGENLRVKCHFDEKVCGNKKSLISMAVKHKKNCAGSMLVNSNSVIGGSLENHQNCELMKEAGCCS
ncbi:hypothetical protein L6452_41812 [Arctium lappa]|uniref:Uncharacterized protein n=1 Tax=Arctium lappa TaxID=4217 RepID=A0ACB8XGX4_ARCLA|nr:hypothetical protein L6452_41812 [Arctium lappa]